MRSLGVIANREDSVRKLVRKLGPICLPQLAENRAWRDKKNGSAQEFGGACILSRFLKNDKFCFCDRHALRLEQ
jgi:hypothetical protein